MPERIIGKKMGDLKALKQSLKKGGAGTFVKFIPKEGSITVRFLDEPTEWINYYEHFDGAIRKSYPCIEAQCPGCATEERRTSRYLANALDIEADRVVPLQLPKTLVSSLVALYERMNTLTDRDIELIRSGEGLDTEYSALPEPPTNRPIAKYDKHDLSAILDSAFNSVFGQDEEDEDNGQATPVAKARPKGKRSPAPPVDTDNGEDRPRKPAPKVPAKKKEPQFTPEVDVDDDPFEPLPEAEDDTEEADYYTAEDLKEMPLGELRAVARDYGIVTKGLGRPDLIEAILNPEEDEE